LDESQKDKRKSDGNGQLIDDNDAKPQKIKTLTVQKFSNNIAFSEVFL